MNDKNVADMKKHMMKMKISMKNMEKCMGGDTENAAEEKAATEEKD